MYTHCIFCKKHLGRNEVIEPFPVGRRLAFDPGKGRLWVVCRKCERWNLSPLEERWEAFEECERRFRAARLRVSTDQIGLARLPDGLELVRIGEPMRPEFAAWRYGDQFGRRRRRTIIQTSAIVAVGGALAIGGAAVGAGTVFAWQIPNLVVNVPVRARFRTKEGKLLKFRHSDLQKTRFVDAERGAWVVKAKAGMSWHTFEGDEAVRATRELLPAVNRMAGSKTDIRNAVLKLEQAGGPERYLGRLTRELDPEHWQVGYGRPLFPGKWGLVHKLPTPTRLALEMALHEEQEMRAMAGELVELELAWRAAEEIAHIADGMFVPTEVERKVEELRKSADT
ncbi:MAG: hypothetical protein PVF27_06120 [Gemmatimonadales bacterium]